MKVLAICIRCALGVALLVPLGIAAQTAPPPALTVLPPPGIDAPGAKPVAPATPLPASTKPAPANPARASTAIPIPALPALQGEPSSDARGEPPPTVKVTRHDGQLIEEYYDGGQLYMVRVHPKHGVPYTYFVDKSHNLTRSPGAPPVSPVLYNILQWGGPSSSSDDSQ